MSYSLGMPVNPNRGAIGRAATIAATAVAALVLLAGCVPPTPTAVPTPVPTTSPAAEPVFASDAEALAAAEEAYVAYLAMSDLIAQEGGRNPERIAPFVTEEQLAVELEGFESLRVSGARAVGESTYFNSVLQEMIEIDGGVEVVVLACLDLRGVSVVGADDAVVRDNTGIAPFTVQLDFLRLASSSDAGLLLSRATPTEAQLQC